MNLFIRTILLAAAWMLGSIQASQPAFAASLQALSSAGIFNVTLRTPGPLAINVMESWVITVTDRALQPVEAATITVEGGMPLHGHGLPTAPAVTKYLGAGRYQLDGVKFNMMGRWVLDLEIVTTRGSDAARVEIDL